MELVAERLDVPPTKVMSVSSFYTMYNKRPVGQHHIQVCVSISCALNGAHRVIEHLEDRFEIRVGETTADGKVTLSEVECLASCGTAPMMQVNEKYYESLTTTEALDAVIDRLLEDNS